MAKSKSALDPIRTIVGATDFSTASKLALDRAADLAEQHRARLVLVHAFWLPPVAAGGADAVWLGADIEVQAREAAKERLEEVVGDLRRGDLEVQSELMTGAPDAVVVEAAERADADLIVVGTQGSSGFRHRVLGSVAESIVGNAPMPVLSVHPNDSKSLDPPKNVLVPTDFSGYSDNAIEELARLFASDGSSSGDAPKIVLLHSDRVPPMVQPFLAVLGAANVMSFRQVEPQLRERTEGVAERLRGWGFDVRVEVEEGEAAQVIVELAGREDIDLIAMGTHGRAGLKRLIMGSTARRVVQHAPCPVLTVRGEG